MSLTSYENEILFQFVFHEGRIASYVFRRWLQYSNKVTHHFVSVSLSLPFWVVLLACLMLLDGKQSAPPMDGRHARPHGRGQVRCCTFEGIEHWTSSTYLLLPPAGFFVISRLFMYWLINKYLLVLNRVGRYDIVLSNLALY